LVGGGGESISSKRTRSQDIIGEPVGNRGRESQYFLDPYGKRESVEKRHA